jgi:predicted CoA-binding protein
VREKVERFLAGSPHAVAGASADRRKYGNKVLRCYVQRGRPVYALHPTLQSIEGVPAFSGFAALPEPVHGVSFVTPPAVTAKQLDEALRAGVRHFWLQPGSEDREAIARAEAAGADVIAWGPCILVVPGYRE